MSLHFLVETTAATYGGTGLAAQRLAESVADQGASVTVHLLRDEEPSWPRGSQANLCWTLLPRRFDRRLRYFWNLGRSEIDCVVHLHGVWNPWWAIASLIFAARKVPFAISPHGSLEQAALDHKPWKKQLAMLLYQRFVLRLASCLVVTSEKEARSLNTLGFDSIRLRRIPNVVEMPLLTRREQGVSAKSSRSILYMSRIHPIKGLPLLVKAWAQVRRSGWRLVIAGSDEAGHLSEVIALAQGLGVRSDFEFLGPVHGSAKQQLFELADVFILPTHSENFGIVIAEALSHGVPVITTKGAPWDELPEKGCGWWCETTEESIGHALEEAMALPSSVLHEMGDRGRKWVSTSFSPEGIAIKAMNLVYMPLSGKGQF